LYLATSAPPVTILEIPALKTRDRKPQKAIETKLIKRVAAAPAMNGRAGDLAGFRYLRRAL
jgi:hypothetical protein